MSEYHNLNYQYIETDDALSKVITELSTKQTLYLDFEFDKNHFLYGFNICLIQISDGSTIYIIDPVTIKDVESLFPIFINEKIQKVSFAFGEDLRLLHHLGCIPKNVLDLATTRTLLNLPHTSLNSIIEEMTGEELPKSQQKSNWCERPLREEQLKYAALDVAFLPALKDLLLSAIEKEGRSEWLEQEIEEINTLDFGKNADPNGALEKEKKYFTKREWLRYDELIEFREKEAEKLNRPTYKVLNKKWVEDLAKNPGLINQWPPKTNIHPKLKTIATKNKIQSILESVEKQIRTEGVSAAEGARSPLSLSEKQRQSKLRSEADTIKTNFYDPIKAEIKKDLGEHIANYLLSNRKTLTIIKDESLLLPYQKEIINYYAQKLNLT